MAKTPTIYDSMGKPINRGVLKRELAAPTMAGARSPVATYPGDGLDPLILASILREADLGNPQRYMALAGQTYMAGRPATYGRQAQP